MVMKYMVADNHAVDIDTIARQIGLVLDTGTLGALSGEQTLSDRQTVTVTKPNRYRSNPIIRLSIPKKGGFMSFVVLALNFTQNPIK